MEMIKARDLDDPFAVMRPIQLKLYFIANLNLFIIG